MARPIKHNADYFSHDNDMRNDLKVKALRRKFSHTGYSIYNMIIELLTNSDYFEYEWNELRIELLTPDFDIDADLLEQIVSYSVKLNLLQLTNGYLHCDKLTERLEEEVLKRRKGYCSDNSKRMGLMLQQPNINVVNVNINEVNDNIRPQSKGKEIKGNKSILNKSKLAIVYNSPDTPIIEDTNVDYMIDETEYEITKPMLETIINKFLKVDSRFKFMSLMSEIDEDYGGFDNLIEMYLPNDTSAQNNWKKQLQQYKNGIYAN
jgi:hypothetical protein